MNDDFWTDMRNVLEEADRYDLADQLPSGLVTAATAAIATLTDVDHDDVYWAIHGARKILVDALSPQAENLS